jgi:hypothetical protein
MELTQGSETSAQYILTPGKYPKEHPQLVVFLLCHWFVFSDVSSGPERG